MALFDPRFLKFLCRRDCATLQELNTAVERPLIDTNGSNFFCMKNISQNNFALRQGCWCPVKAPVVAESVPSNCFDQIRVS